MAMRIKVLISGKVSTAKIAVDWLRHYEVASKTACGVEIYRALPSHPFYAWYSKQG